MTLADKLSSAGHRASRLWIAFLVHRLSGLALACFLPLHFLMLGTALRGEAQLETLLRWTANPLVKWAEAGLVFLLSVHLFGGLRVLVVENLTWRAEQRSIATAALIVAAITAVAFIIFSA
jgi:fumarate reductase subunit D